MEFLILLFVIVFPVVAIGMSAYCLIQFSGLKKAASKQLAMLRVSGKGGRNG